MTPGPSVRYPRGANQLGAKIMDEKAIKAEMRLYVIEVFVANLFAMYCLQTEPSAPLAAFATMKNQLLDGARKLTIPDVDPGVSALLSEEIEDAVAHLATLVNEQISGTLQFCEGKKGGT
jgi:hypothetical protein